MFYGEDSAAGKMMLLDLDSVRVGEKWQMRESERKEGIKKEKENLENENELGVFAAAALHKEKKRRYNLRKDVLPWGENLLHWEKTFALRKDVITWEKISLYIKKTSYVKVKTRVHRRKKKRANQRNKIKEKIYWSRLRRKMEREKIASLSKND